MPAARQQIHFFKFLNKNVKTSPPPFFAFFAFFVFWGWGGLSWPESDSARKIIIKHGGKKKSEKTKIV